MTTTNTAAPVTTEVEVVRDNLPALHDSTREVGLPPQKLIQSLTDRYTEAQLEAIRANGGARLDEAEFRVFMYAAEKTGLDPLTRQIYAVKRYSKKDQREVMTIQTGIDGYRLIADRTGCYAPADETPVFEYDDQGNLFACTNFVKKYIPIAKEWARVPVRLLLDEFRGDTAFWGRMEHNQLAKCAEAAAIRKAFPADTAGVYLDVEMQRAELERTVETTARPAIRPPQAKAAAAPAAPAKAAPAGSAANPTRRAAPKGSGNEKIVRINAVTEKQGQRGAFWVIDTTGGKFSLFDKNQRLAAQTAKDRGWDVRLELKENGKFVNVEKVTMLEPEAPADDAPPADDIPPGADPLSDIPDDFGSRDDGRGA